MASPQQILKQAYADWKALESKNEGKVLTATLQHDVTMLTMGKPVMNARWFFTAPTYWFLNFNEGLKVVKHYHLLLTFHQVEQVLDIFEQKTFPKSERCEEHNSYYNGPLCDYEEECRSCPECAAEDEYTDWLATPEGMYAQYSMM